MEEAQANFKENLNMIMRLDNTQMKTLKSQLRVRPAYNELIKEITKEEYYKNCKRGVIDRNV